MFSWLKSIKLPKFIKDFIASMSNTGGGFSLRKLIAIGLFWDLSFLVIKHTDKDNVVSVVTILCSTLVTFVITYSVSNVQEMKLTKKPDTADPDPTEVK